MRNASGETSTNLSVGIFSPSGSVPVAAATVPPLISMPSSAAPFG
jgi:hypothetical protein